MLYRGMCPKALSHLKKQKVPLPQHLSLITNTFNCLYGFFFCKEYPALCVFVLKGISYCVLKCLLLAGNSHESCLITLLFPHDTNKISIILVLS